MTTVIELSLIVYLIGLVGTTDILWPLKQIPAYRRLLEQKEAEHKLKIAQLELEERETRRVINELDDKIALEMVERHVKNAQKSLERIAK